MVEVDLDPLAAVPTAVLRIENDQARPATSGTGSGSGLLGLQERLAGLGGDLCWQAEPGRRFVVQARVPLTGPSPAPHARLEP
jgi:two-component system sensor histidine kinase DesK